MKFNKIIFFIISFFCFCSCSLNSLYLGGNNNNIIKSADKSFYHKTFRKEPENFISLMRPLQFFYRPENRQMTCFLPIDPYHAHIHNDNSTSFPEIPENFYKKYSRRLGIKLAGNENPRLIKAIDEWIGTPYKWGGCSKSGIDCSCLVKKIYKKAYKKEIQRTSLTILHDNLVPVKKKLLSEGDIIFFRMDGLNISHMGIYLKDGLFVHASRSQGVMISSLSNPYFSRRFVAGGSAVEKKKRYMARLSIGKLIVIDK